MPQIELPKLRRHGDLFFNLTLADGGVQVSWDSVIIMQLFMYSEKQRGFAGRCSFGIDQADPHTLRVKYPYGSQRFLGIHRVVVQVELAGGVKTYDARVCNIVASTSDATVDYDTVLDVPITVSDVDTTIMHEILEACIRATAEANEAAAAAEESVAVLRGGQTGQVLTKRSDSPLDFEWKEEVLISQDEGQSQKAVMSQKAVTDRLAMERTGISTIMSRLDCVATTYPMGEGVKVYEDVIITEINP